MSQLSQGCIRRVHAESGQKDLTDGVVVQVLDVKKIDPKPGQQGDRYRFVLSDGEYYIQGMLATQLNSKVSSGELQANSIVRLNHYICNEIAQKKVLIMLDVTVLVSVAEPVGQPTNIQTAGAASAGTPQPYGGVKQENRSYVQKGGAGAAAAGPPAPVARVTSKGEVRKFNTAKGEGTLFSVDLLDAQGGQIRATMFKEACDKFFNIFQENQVYVISGGQVKMIQNKKYNRLPNDYEMTLNVDASVTPVEDDAAIETTRFEFVPIENILKTSPEDFVDVIGVCTAVGPSTNITSKAGRELNKRSLTLLDRTLCQVEVTLWGEQADKWNEHTLGESSIVAVKTCKVSDFGGRSLSSSFQSQLFVNPDHPEAHQLRAWFDQNGGSLTNLQNISKQPRGGDLNAGGAAGNTRKVLSDIKDEGLGRKAAPDFFVTRATITFFRHDWEKPTLPWYNACPSGNCNKKVVEENGGWHCDKCQRNFPDATQRYILSLMVCDPTGSTWLTAFDDAARALLGGTTAKELADLVKSDQKELASAKFKQHNFKEYLFKIRVRAETVADGDEQVRAHIISASPINYLTETQYLLDEIAKYD